WTPVNVRIGGNGGTAQWDGLIDEVRIYNRALSQSEVTDIYNTRKMTNPWREVTGFWTGTTNVLNYPDMIGDSTGYIGGEFVGDTIYGKWYMSPHNAGDTAELTDYYFDNKRFTKITAVSTDADIRQNIVPGTFGDTLGKSWSIILKKGVGDSTHIYFFQRETPQTQYSRVLITWYDRTVSTVVGDTSKTLVEWFTDEIVRISGTSNPIKDIGDTHSIIIEPQEMGTGYIYATAVQVEDRKISTPYVNGTRLPSTYFFDREMPVSGTLECYVRGRSPVDEQAYSTGQDTILEWGTDNTHRLNINYQNTLQAFQVYWINGGTGRELIHGDSYLGDSEYWKPHHLKFIWNFGDTSLYNCKLIIDGVTGDSGWSGIPDTYSGDTADVISSLGIGGRQTLTDSLIARFNGEITDLLIKDDEGDSTIIHFENGVPYFYPDPFPINTKWVYRVQTIDTSNKVGGDTTKSLQSNLFDSSEGRTWNAISGDSVLELGDSHDYKRNEYVIVDETINSNGYYLITRVEDTNIFIYPNLTSGDVTGKVYPTTSSVFILE
ncbi:MAG: hypothetical protein PHQ86_02765, partial [Dehalococcoidales bacterium]|nr:hypothetical protein [Dehalococcoidales bacterium]